MKFLIQTIDGQIKHDFSFTLLESINYHNWLGKTIINYKLTDDAPIPNYIPIGSVKF